MSVLIAFRGRYGTTAGCARDLAALLRSPCTLADLARTPSVDISSFDTVVIGGAIYGGKILPPVTDFCERHRDELLEKKVGVFICCLSRGAHARAQLAEAFPEWLLARTFAQAFAGGEIRRARLSLLDRLLVRRLAPDKGRYFPPGRRGSPRPGRFGQLTGRDVIRAVVEPIVCARGSSRYDGGVDATGGSDDRQDE